MSHPNPRTNTIFIVIGGVGSNFEDVTIKDPITNNIFVNINYNSTSIMNDLSSFRKNAKAVKGARAVLTGPNATGNNSFKEARVVIEANERFQKQLGKKFVIHKLKENIKSALDIINSQQPPQTDIIVIGISHGSIIVHAALIKLNIERPFSLQLLSNIQVWSIGSPQYIPENLFGLNITNFYHIKDPFLKLFNNYRVVKWLFHSKVPKIPSPDMLITSQSTKHFPTPIEVKDHEFNNFYKKIYEKEQKDTEEYNKNRLYLNQPPFVFVKDESHLTGEKVNFITIQKTYRPYKHTQSLVTTLRFHDSFFNLYPLLDYRNMYILDFADIFDDMIAQKNKLFQTVSKQQGILASLTVPTTSRGGSHRIKTSYRASKSTATKKRSPPKRQ